MNCPFCKRPIDDPDKLKHLIECQKQEEEVWNSRFKAMIKRETFEKGEQA
jgi:hypothetical protein